MILYFANLLVVSVVVTCTDISIEETFDYAFRALKHENLLEGLTDEAFLARGVCNDTNPCENAGACYDGACRCSKDYTGSRCEAPTWCTDRRCGYRSDVECVWDRFLRKGECRCKKEKYHYLQKEKKCHECDCGADGNCLLVDDLLVCKCDEKYALKSSKCKFCDCGDHGKCWWQGSEKICDCEDGFRSFEGKCKDCNCGQFGVCELNEFGEKVCSCDLGFAEYDGTCRTCKCNLPTRRYVGIGCKFDHDGEKQCICPPGFETESEYCQDIDECSTTHPCPDNTRCINKPGTYDCRCKEGFEPADWSLNPKLSGCKDIDECLDFPCQFPATRCVNSLGSYDCVCKDGYYSTSGSYGSSYKPAHNNCYEIETQWRGATIALGVIFSVLIIGMTSYIKKHKGSS